MAENPLQHLLQAFGKVSVCVQTHLSQFILRSHRPSLSLNQNDHSSLYISPNSTADSHLLQSAEIFKKGKSSGRMTKEELGRLLDFSSHSCCSVSGQANQAAKEGCKRAAWES
ncbi:unnamed protein product [Fraxinus pennsylvanica]|uniref:Uncharacterized protein n=1 Tax=Fraxinus pennsylvanica TaxID=56036 RepID=A0AAD1ZL11_9LAMI|nr:unnamed protein product [Fraxinus pennsylvanica]